MLLILMQFLFFIANSKALQWKNNVCKHYYNYPMWFASPNCYYDPDIKAFPADIIKRYGYKEETYEITTADGYILTLFRILPNTNVRNHQPIFMLHGITASQKTFLAHDNESLALYLAEAGWEVWLGTVRGAIFSGKHQRPHISDRDYWNFNLDTMAKYDVAEQIRFVANVTGKPGSLVFVGHSQGATLGFMYASENRDAHNLIRGFVALCPVVYLDNIPRIWFVTLFLPNIKKFLDFFEIQRVLPYPNIIQTVLSNQCKLFPYGCVGLIEILFGKLSKNFHPDSLLWFYDNWLIQTSTGGLAQFGQIAHSHKFRKYDYGKRANLKRYNQEQPPEYDLSKIRFPVFMFYGENDNVATEQNILRAVREVGSNEKFVQKIPIGRNKMIKYNHLDFFYDRNLKEDFYEPFLKTIKKLSFM